MSSLKSILNKRKNKEIILDGFSSQNQSQTQSKKNEEHFCPNHSCKCLELPCQHCMPLVKTSLAELRPNVVQLLQEHKNQLPFTSFIHFYERKFGPLRKTIPLGKSVSPLIEYDLEKKLAVGRRVLEKLVNVENFVCLEHLITCVPGVYIRTSVNGVKVVTLSQTYKEGNSKENDNAHHKKLFYYPAVKTQRETPKSMRDVPPAEFPSMQFQANLRQLRHEVVELVKHQPGSILLMDDFIPAYQAHFGKSCHFSDYGFSRLEDIMDALKDLVHIVGEHPLRTIMLTHVIQVRRFTHDLLKLLKGEQKKSIPVSKLPQAYEATFHKAFMPSNYGVCSLVDLLTDVPENKLSVENNDDEGLSIAIPRRIQTAQQKVRTQLFAIEVIHMLSPMRRFQIAFTKFIPAYHHAFSRQCRVSEYGFLKLIELLEALPNVVEIFNEDGERYIRLVNRLRLARIKEILFEILECQTFRPMLLSDLTLVFQTDYRLNLVPQDYGFTSLEELFASFPGVFLLHQEGLSPTQTSQDDKAVSLFQQPTYSMTGDGPKVQPPKCDVKREDMPCTMTYVYLEDRHNIKRKIYRCLQILFNSPSGSIPAGQFTKHFQATFHDDFDIDMIQNEMNPYILVNECKTQAYDSTIIGEDLTNEDHSTNRIIHLCPLISFARQLRFLLLRTRGRLVLSLLGTAYNREYGVEIRPETYGYPSLLTLVNAVNFMVVVRGRGAKSTLFLSQNYLGKLAWIIAFKIPFHHDLLFDPAELSVKPTELLQLTVTNSKPMPPSCDSYLMKTQAEQKLSATPWRYPPSFTSDSYFMEPTTVAGTISPLNSITVDSQQQVHEYSMVLQNIFTPGREARCYTCTETTSTTRHLDFGTPCWNPEMQYSPSAHFLRYPQAQTINDSINFTANRPQLHVSNDEVTSHILSIPASEVWSQSSDLQMLPTPFYQFQVESPSLLQPFLLKPLITYGNREPYCVSHLVPGLLFDETTSSTVNSTVNILPSEQPVSPSTESGVFSAETKGVGSSSSRPRLIEELTPPSKVKVQLITTNPSPTYLNYHPTKLTGMLSQAAQYDGGSTLIFQSTRRSMASSLIDNISGFSTTRNGIWKTDLSQWVNACKLPAQWPVFQSIPLDPLAQMQPAPVLVPQAASNGTTLPYEETHVINTLTFSQTPIRHTTKEDLGVSNSSPENKCEEGDWTLPISVTTESTDANSGENDETGSLG